MTALSRKQTNRLAKESSPYLLQHQHNPVDWYPWGPEAFAAARAQDKPIFLSVGYSTCYWCHVMERQCFEVEAIAAEMNQRFINIKVDREERPDVDQLYMSAVQILTRHGGWPMSVFLTPDLRPFYGGTYFPPQDMHGRPGFVTVLRGIEDAYRNRLPTINQSADQLVTILRGLSEPQGLESPMTIDDRFIQSLIDRSIADYDPKHGGFGGAPKFPRETLLELLLVHQAHSPSATRKRMLLHALDAMMYGGIRDQLGGGFHRYSTDAQWLVPHFEIMLYDNAMLAWCYVEAHRQTGDARYAKVAREILDFILREMTSPAGAFYTALDAEVDSQEGLNYLWTAGEIGSILGADDAKLFNRVYGVDRGPNFADPHHGDGTPRNSILYVADVAEFERNIDRLTAMRQKLKAVRDGRKQPLLDTKILTSWNALAIRALAYAGKILVEPRYAAAAERCSEFLLTHHAAPDGGLFRTSRDGSAKYAAFLDDYAFFIQALIALYDATGQEKWRTEADRLAAVMLDRFDDRAHGGFYFTHADAKDLIVRQKTASDSPLPSGNAACAMVMLEMNQPAVARRVLNAFAGQLERGAEGMSSMVLAAHLYVTKHGAIEIETTRTDPSQERSASPEQIAAGVVAMRATWVSPTELRVRVDVLDGFHINSNTASADLVATALAIGGIEPDKIVAIDYPPGESRRFAFADEALSVYEGSITIAARFQSPVTAELTLRLTYQACDESTCLPPVTRRMTVSAV